MVALLSIKQFEDLFLYCEEQGGRGGGGKPSFSQCEEERAGKWQTLGDSSHLSVGGF